MAFPTQHPLQRLLQLKLDARLFMTADVLTGWVRVVDHQTRINVGVVKFDDDGSKRILETTKKVTKDQLACNDVTQDDLDFDGLFGDLWEAIEDQWPSPRVA